MGTEKCIKCGSDNVMYSRKRGVYICEDCAHEYTGLQHHPLRIFLSNGSAEHEPLALQVKSDLEARGYEVWYDPERANAGEALEQYLEAGLKWANERPEDGRFIVLLTPSSVRRPDGFCLSDISRAVQQKMRIVPLMVSWCEPPLSICRIQWLDMMDCFPTGADPDKYRRQLQLLAQALEQEARDFRGVQSRLLQLLEPLPFDADIQKHLLRFTGRRWVFERIDAWLAKPDAAKVFWIIGAPGVGKSAIASWLCFNKREIAAFHLCSQDNVLKSDARRAVLSIAYQLSTQLPDYQARLSSLNLEKAIEGANAKALFDLLIVQPLSVGFPDPCRTIIILIDALDEATKGGKNELVEFIASEFPKTPVWLRLILTSRPEPEVMHPLQGLSPYVLDTSSPENEGDIRDYLAREIRPFSHDPRSFQSAIDRITKLSEGIFLYVEWIRKELALGRLSLDNLEGFPRGLTGVYSQFFQREYPDKGTYDAQIRPVLEVVASALEPLSVAMISSIFGWDEYDRADFFDTIGTLFPTEDNCVKPFHRSVIDWLVDLEKALDYTIDPDLGNERLSRYGWAEFQRGVPSMPPYMIAHLPAHLISASRWEDAVDMLADLIFLAAAWKISEFDVKAYWSTIEDRSGLKLIEVYAPILQDPVHYGERVLIVANLLSDTGHLAEAVVLFDYLIDHYRNNIDDDMLQVSLGKKGLILYYMGELDNAMRHLKEKEAICKKIGNKNELQTCFSDQVKVMYVKGDMNGIIALYNEMERIFEGQISKSDLHKFIGAKALVLLNIGDLKGALKLYQEKELICREIKDKNGLINALNNQSLLLYDTGDLDGAMKVNKEMEQVCREIGNKYALSFSLVNRTDILYDRGQLDEAMELLKEAERICREIGDKNGVRVSLSSQALILYDRGELGEAMQLFKEEEGICLEISDKHGLQTSLGNQAIIYHDRGDLDTAMKLLKEKEKICRETSNKPSLQTSLGSQALILYDQGQIDEAFGLHSREEELCREMGYQKDLQISLGNQANIHYIKGMPDEAMRFHSEEEQICRQLDIMRGLATCLINKAVIVNEKGYPEEAENLLKEAEDICRRIGTPKGLQACLGNRAVLCHASGDVTSALDLLGEAEAICRSLCYPEGLSITLINRAILLAYDLGRPAEGLTLAEEACGIVRRCGMQILVNKMEPLRHMIMRRIEFPATNDCNAVLAPELITWVVKKPKPEKK